MVARLRCRKPRQEFLPDLFVRELGSRRRLESNDDQKGPGNLNEETPPRTDPDPRMLPIPPAGNKRQFPRAPACACHPSHRPRGELIQNGRFLPDRKQTAKLENHEPEPIGSVHSGELRNSRPG
jgi:hypothetical protein